MADSRIDPKDVVRNALRSTGQPRTMTEISRQWRIGMSSVSKGLGRLLEAGEVQCEVVERKGATGLRMTRLWSLEESAPEPEPEPEVEERHGLGCLSCDTGVRHGLTALCKPCHDRVAVRAAKDRLEELEALRDRARGTAAWKPFVALMQYWERKAGKQPKEVFDERV